MTPSAEGLLQSASVAGVAARPAGAGDRVEDVTPQLVVEPRTADETAAVLAWAAGQRLSVVVRGGGTKLAWGRRPDAVDVLVRTARLNRVLAHAHADLTATVEAGLGVEAFNEILGGRGQWLPVDALEDGTIGGAIATNDSGPLRHRFGTPRDLLIGVQLALSDGRLIKAGGTVVKNVAGYDLGRLVSGSFGSLAAIVSATFKLLPLPAASRTMSARFGDAAALAAAVERLSGSQLEPIALEVHVGPGDARVLVRFATSPAAVDAQIDAARGLVAGAEVDVAGGDREAALWRRYHAQTWAAPGTLVRLTWLPAHLPALLSLIEELRRDAALELHARAGIGSGLLRIDAPPPAQVAIVERLREASSVVRHAVLVRAEAAVKQQVDVWGDLGAAAALGAAVKRALDPAGILNAGRGPV